MAWCPKCRYEYRDGIEMCPDCKVALVDELPPTDNELSGKGMDFSNEQFLNMNTENNSEFGNFTENSSSDIDKQVSDDDKIKVYQDKKTKAEDFKSSAYTLIIMGVLGLVALVLIELGIIPLHLAVPGKYITYTVMSVMFIIFIITGIGSFRSFKKYASEAKSEDELTESIISWAHENINKEYITGKAGALEETTDEIKYFKYFEILKNSITAQFGELDASYLEAICEELYADIFEN